MHNDLDRDIVKGINSVLSECLSIIQTINDNKFVPHITQQPVDATAALDETVTFTVVANNVKSYQWQYSTNQGGTWSNTSQIGNKTATLTTTATSGRYNWLIRCQITGKDMSVIYTNNVKILRPET